MGEGAPGRVPFCVHEPVPLVGPPRPKSGKTSEAALVTVAAQEPLGVKVALPPPPAGAAQVASSRRNFVLPAVAPGSGTAPAACDAPLAMKAGRRALSTVPLVMLAALVASVLQDAAALLRSPHAGCVCVN